MVYVQFILQVYHQRSRSEEVCNFDKPLTSLRVYQNCKLPLTSTSGGIVVEYTYKPWLVYYIYMYIILHEPATNCLC